MSPADGVVAVSPAHAVHGYESGISSGRPDRSDRNRARRDRTAHMERRSIMIGRGFGRFGGRLAQRGFAHPGFFFPLGGFLFFMFAALLVALMVVAVWRVSHKAGFPGVLGLLMLVPVVNVGVMLFLGFADWPALRAPAAPAAVAAAPPVAPPTAPAVEATPPVAEPGDVAPPTDPSA
jgi:hypothetical protein